VTTTRLLLLSAILAVTVAVAVGCQRTAAPSGQSALAPDFSATDLDGKTISLDRYKGKILIINYFATWCPPCRVEIPDFVEAYKDHRKDGLEFLGVDLGESPDTVKEFVNEQKINYPVIAGDRDMEDKFGPVHSIPVTIVIDREGRIATKKIGMLSSEELDEIIQSLLQTESK